jgi:hypothetical protein
MGKTTRITESTRRKGSTRREFLKTAGKIGAGLAVAAGGLTGGRLLRKRGREIFKKQLASYKANSVLTDPEFRRLIDEMAERRICALCSESQLPPYSAVEAITAVRDKYRVSLGFAMDSVSRFYNEEHALQSEERALDKLENPLKNSTTKWLKRVLSTKASRDRDKRHIEERRKKLEIFGDFMRELEKKPLSEEDSRRLKNFFSVFRENVPTERVPARTR